MNAFGALVVEGDDNVLGTLMVEGGLIPTGELIDRSEFPSSCRVGHCHRA
jgi:hypothetical protein